MRAVAFCAFALAACGLTARGAFDEAAPDTGDGGASSSSSSSSSSGSGGTDATRDATAADGGDSSSPDSGCVDITADPNNCGECGRSCLGTTCTAGLCAPTLLGDALSEPYGVVLANGVAYVAEHARGHIRQVVLDGGGHSMYFNTGQAPWSLARGPDAIYWGEQTKVRSKPFAAANSIDVGVSGGDACSVAVNGAKLYFGICAGGDVIRSADLDMTDENDVGTSQNDPRGIAFDATHVYWANNSGGTIARAPLAGGDVETVVSGESGSDTIAVVSGFVYWTVPGAIRRAPIGGAVPWTATTFVPGEGRPRSLASDGTRLYWLDSNLGLLRRVDTAKGPPALTLASNESQQAAVSVNTAIAFDATHVYWVTNTAGGTLKRVPK